MFRSHHTGGDTSGKQQSPPQTDEIFGFNFFFYLMYTAEKQNAKP